MALFASSKILILCTGNSCRSQMAEAFLKSFDNTLQVFSAGTEPANQINPFTIKVMAEVGIHIDNTIRPKHVNLFLNDAFDYLITVCDDAKESCPVFYGQVTYRLHFGFEDPANAKGNEEDILNSFRKVRDEIKTVFFKWYLEIKN